MKKKVIHIFSHMNRGGAETLILNVHRNLRNENLEFYYLVHPDKIGQYDEEIRNLGGHLIYIDHPKQNKSYIKDLKQIFKKIKPDIVHSHVFSFSGIVLKIAKECGVKIRIAHSHTTRTSSSKKLIKRIYFMYMKYLIKKNANICLACSTEAGEILFGKKHPFEILYNGIDLKKYTDAKNIRKELIKNFNLNENIKIIGHIGSFREVKNHNRLIEIFFDLTKIQDNVVLILVGEGELRGGIQDKVLRLGIQNKVYFLGSREDIPELLKSFDLFILPSYYEGLGLVLVEAQTAGVPSIVSSTVPQIVDMNLNLINFIDLKKSNKEWNELIIKQINQNNIFLNQFNDDMNKYDIKLVVRNLENLYLKEF